MGCVPRGAIATIGSALRDIARRHLPLELVVTAARGVRSSRHVNAWYEIERTRALLALHREALSIVETHRVSRRPHRDMFAVAADERVSASTLRWVSRFSEDSSGAAFRPHVTLGRGEPARVSPFTFRATTLALFQLGGHCTCRRLLIETRRRR